MENTKKSTNLMETNSHLRNKRNYEKALVRNVVSSSRIEGIKVSSNVLSKVKI